MVNKTNLSKRKLSVVLAASCFILWLFIQFDLGNSVASNVINKEIELSNLAYLSSEEEQSKDALLKLTEIFTVLEVVRTSKVGVSFFVDVNIEIGNLIVSLSEAAKKGLLISTAAMASSVILKSFVTFAALISPTLFKYVLLLMTIKLLSFTFFEASIISNFIGKLFKLTLILFLVANVIVPYTIHGSAVISSMAIQKIKNQNREHLEHLYSHHSSFKNKGSMKDRAEEAINLFEKYIVHLPQIVEKTSTFIAYHLALFLFQSIILPIALLVGLFWGMKNVLTWNRELLSEYNL